MIISVILQKNHLSPHLFSSAVVASEPDYSGTNAITQNIFNYGSDVIHYRKKVENLIYKEIYR